MAPLEWPEEQDEKYSSKLKKPTMIQFPLAESNEDYDIEMPQPDERSSHYGKEDLFVPSRPGGLHDSFYEA